MEFILCSGDIVHAQMGGDPDAMQQGSRLHRKIQKQQTGQYRAEVPLTLTVPITADGESFLIFLFSIPYFYNPNKCFLYS